MGVRPGEIHAPGRLDRSSHTFPSLSAEAADGDHVEGAGDRLLGSPLILTIVSGGETKDEDSAESL